MEQVKVFAESTLGRGMTEPAWTHRDVLALSELEGDPDWLRSMRLAAWDRYAQTPMPTLRDEAWRKTDLSAIHWDRLRPYTVSRGPSVPRWKGLPEALRALGPDEESEFAGLSVHQEATELYRFLREDLRRQGVLLMSLKRAIHEAPHLVRAHLFRLVPPGYHQWAALHAALVHGGVFLYVPPGVEVEAPLLTTYWHAEEGRHVSPHTLVVLGKGSAATLVEASHSPDSREQSLATGVAEVFVGEDANLRYLTFQEWHDGMMEIATRRLHLRQGAKVQWTTANLGARLSRNDLGSILAGEGAEAEMFGLAFVSGRQHLDQQTFQEHQVGHTRSDLLFKVAVRKRSRAVYRGVVRIHPQAQRADAYQANRNLLLSPGAKVETRPILEIEANDVRCTHGASLGKVDAEQMFYLRARGLAPVRAERLLVEAFFSEILDRVPVESLRQRIERWIEKKLEAE